MDILLASRVGDLDRVRYLVEERGHDVNIINEYDVSPLYNAALCGHTHVVKYLLEKGAVAEENTYMGERVFYAALTDDLRRFLRHYGQSTAAHRDPYLESLRKLFEQRDSLWPDLTIVLGDTEMHVHRVILRCRCPYFEKAFAGKWKDRTRITLSQSASPEVMQALIQYMYTGRLDLPASLAQEATRVCSKLGMDDLVEALEDRLEGLKIRRCREGVQLLIEARRDWLERDYSRLAKEVVGRLFVSDADVCVHCDGRYLSLHRVLLCGRSAYFSTLFTCPFFAEAAQFRPSPKPHPSSSSQPLPRGATESQSHASAEEGGREEKGGAPVSCVVSRGVGGALPTVRVYDVSASAFAQVVEYCYTDTIADLRVPLVVEVLEAATRFLLDGLRSLCTSFLIQHSDEVELLSLLHIATLYSLPRLEHHCLSLFARDLDDVIHSSEFMDLVVESAASIEARQETDSIPLLDDIRHHIHRLHVTRPEEMHRKYDLVDALLDKLNLSA